MSQPNDRQLSALCQVYDFLLSLAEEPETKKADDVPPTKAATPPAQALAEQPEQTEYTTDEQK